MTSTIRNILIAAGAYGAYRYFNTKKNQVEEFQQSATVGVNSIELDTSNIFAPQLLLMLSINNPSTAAANISKIFATVKLPKGDTIATINQNMSQQINPQETNDFVIPLNIQAVNIIQAALGGSLALLVNVDGYAIINGITINFSKQYGIDLSGFLPTDIFLPKF